LLPADERNPHATVQVGQDFVPLMTKAVEYLREHAITLVPGPGPVRYTFGQIPQQLLAGDTPAVILAGVDEPENGVGQHQHHKG